MVKLQWGSVESLEIIMIKREEILKRYQILCKYCDTLFLSVTTKYKSQIKCCKGCCECCKLEAVNALEMWAIYRYLKDNNLTLTNESDSNSCAMLKDGYCMIYDVRPFVCRTHGLILKNSKYAQQTVRTCKKNFTCDMNIESNLVLDTNRMTFNLVRLNNAFCTCIGKNELLLKSFYLKDLLSPNETSDSFTDLQGYL